MKGGLPYIKRHSLCPGNEAESLRQGQVVHILVRDQRLLSSSSELPVRTEGTDQSRPSTESVRLLRSLHHDATYWEKIH